MGIDNKNNFHLNVYKIFKNVGARRV